MVELGCGRGENLRLLSELLGARGSLVAVDSCPESISYIRRTAGAAKLKNVSVHLSRGDSLPIPPDSVDIILCRGLVSPSGPRAAVYREMIRVLRPGGKFLVHDIVVHNLLPPEIADSVTAFSSGLAGAIEARSYRRMLEGLGLKNVALTHCPQPALLERLLIPTAGPHYRHTENVLPDALMRLRKILPDYISVVRIDAML